LQIQVLSVTPSQAPAKTPGKTYSVLEVAFKNLTFGGKVEGKKLMGFGAGKAAYDTLLKANPNEVYEVETNKNAAGYIDWITAVKSDGTPAATNVSQTRSTSSPSGTATTAAPRSNYETPEERAKKQVYIVRQSSISNAVDLLSVGQKSPPAIEAVIEAAKQFEDYVFGTSNNEVGDVSSAFDMGVAKPSGPVDLNDDIPFN
jgi:ABC-type phosphate transport system substrate-binding protein